MDIEEKLDAINMALPKARRDGSLATLQSECDQLETNLKGKLSRLCTFRARIARASDLADEEIEFLNKAIAADQANHAAYYGLMTAWAKKNALDEIVKNANRLLELDQQARETSFTDVATLFLAYACWKKGLVSDAERYLCSVGEFEDIMPLIGTGLTFVELRNSILGR